MNAAFLSTLDDAEKAGYPADYISGDLEQREREKVMDVEKNWALAKELVSRCDVQFILLDRRVQAVLYDWALKHGEDKAWLDSLFHAGLASVFQHARRHRDHPSHPSLDRANHP